MATKLNNFLRVVQDVGSYNLKRTCAGNVLFSTPGSYNLCHDCTLGARPETCLATFLDSDQTTNPYP